MVISALTRRPSLDLCRVLPARGSASIARVSGLVLALICASCRTIPVREIAPVQSWNARRAQLQERAAFELKGRVAVAVGSEGFNARLRWMQQGTASHLALDGPLGAGGVQVTSDGSRLSVVTSKGERLDSEAARGELAARLGFDPPLSSLRFWILGVPDPGGAPAQELLDEPRQHLAHLQQDGWEIDYGGYMPAGGESLPAKLTLQRQNIRVRVIVDGWGS